MCASDGTELTDEGMIVNLEWLSGFAWRTGMRGVLVIEESYRLEKLGQGVEVTHRLSCSGLFSWLGYPFFRRACRIFLTRSNEALERHFRKRSVQDRKSTRLNSSHSCAPRMPSSACKKQK